MSVSIMCAKCGKLITHMTMIKPLKDNSELKSGKCPFCGTDISFSEFDIDVEKK